MILQNAAIRVWCFTDRSSGNSYHRFDSSSLGRTRRSLQLHRLDRQLFFLRQNLWYYMICSNQQSARLPKRVLYRFEQGNKISLSTLCKSSLVNLQIAALCSRQVSDPRISAMAESQSMQIIIVQREEL